MSVATDLSSATGRYDVRVPVRRHRRRAILLVALAVFQFWLWGTRIVNLLQDVGDFSTAFVTIHLGLYTAAIGAGILLLVLGVWMWVEARRSLQDAGGDQDRAGRDPEVPGG